MNTSKTLLAILVEELPKIGGWPEGVTAITQDSDAAINTYNSADGLEVNEYGTWRCLDSWIDYCITAKNSPCLASDYATAIITRDQYEAALIDRPEYFADAEGWTPWCGGKCPVDVRAIVDVRFNNGDIQTNQMAGGYSWVHEWEDSNIIAYRLHQQQDANSRANDDRLEQDSAFKGISLRHRRDGFETPKASTTDAEADLNECIGQAPGAPVWDGEGVPPIGAAIVWREGKRWYPGTVTGLGEQLIIIKDQHGEEGSYRLDVAVIRPATFERDELADAMEQSADKHRGFVDVFKLVADDLMAAGYRKQ